MKRQSSAIPSENDIATLNELYRRCLATSSDLGKAYAEWSRRCEKSASVKALQKKYQNASKRFDDFKCRLNGDIKFDIERGEYFPAHDEIGMENFRIKVTASRTMTINLSSTSAEHAMESAKACVYDGKTLNFGNISYEFEDVSR